MQAEQERLGASALRSGHRARLGPRVHDRVPGSAGLGGALPGTGTRGPNTTMADDEFRMNMQRKLAQQLQEVAQERRDASLRGAPPALSRELRVPGLRGASTREGSAQRGAR